VKAQFFVEKARTCARVVSMPAQPIRARFSLLLGDHSNKQQAWNATHENGTAHWAKTSHSP
jgi:hypothetical protein